MPNQVIPPSPGSPGEELDTGTGGFPVEGKRNAYDVGSTVGDEAKPDWSPGGVNVDQTQHDLSKGTKRTLASYLSKTSMGQTPSAPSPIPNKYPIDQSPLEDPITVSLKDERGYPSSPTGVSNTSKFVIDSMISSRSEAATNLKMVRGRQFPYGGSSVDGNTLLKNATTRTSDTVVNPSALGGKLPPLQTTEIDDTSPIKNYYGNPNVSNSVIFNRFNPVGNEYEKATGLTTDQFAAKYAMGTSAAERNMSFGKLAQVGNALSTRAGVEFTSDTDPTGQMSTATAILPGGAQLGGTRIERDILTARSVIDDMLSGGEPGFIKDLIGLNEDKGGKNISENLLTDPAAKSWGTLNNVLDEYSGLSSVGMQLLSVALMGVLFASISTLGFLLTLSGADVDTLSVIDKETQRRHYGAYEWDSNGSSNYNTVTGIIDQIRSGKFNFWRLIGVKSTRHPFDKCLTVGALAFFGIDDSSATISTAPGVVKTKADIAVVQSPGFYAVMARSVNRSFLQISDIFVSLGKAFASTNIAAGVKQLLSLVDVLRNSKFMQAVGIFSSLGDRCMEINSASPWYVKDDNSTGAGVRFLSEIDSAPNNAAGKGRLGNIKEADSIGTTLAWSTFRARDLLIAPKGFAGSILGITKDKELGVPSFQTSKNPKELPGEVMSYKTPEKSGAESRISTEDREVLEAYLESEYVPFYIHDVRTNEILGFHAFLASLSDDYTANYDTSEGFGRVEPIKVYKSTTRKIGFSFYIAATSKDDFDAMWLKINKLTTMVYPQFTEGRSLKGSDGSVIYAPFSQTISASPLVRVRIGDLIKSNYSKFNLARIFGYTYDGVKFPIIPSTPVTGSQINLSDPSAKPPDEEMTAAWERLKSVLESSSGNTFTTTAPLSCQISGKGSIATGATDPIKPLTDPNLYLPPGLELKHIAKDQKSEMQIFKVVVGPKGLSGADRMKYSGGSGPKNDILGESYAFWPTQLIPTDETKAKMTTTFAEFYTPGQQLSKVKSFMDDNPNSSSGNIVVKSFRSSGGKGLAGFIESMSFDWYDRVPWTTGEGEGRTAPKMCKVTISFSPIHDIAPGLDHTGFNRAPIYPVGPMSPT